MPGDEHARRATMTDVATAAQVSLKTVSRFVNGATNIGPANAERIAEAIATLAFRRNVAAASIRPGQRSQLVGLIIEDVANPYYAALTRAVETVLRPAGLLLLAASSEEDSGLFCRLIERLIERRVDGLIVVPPSDPGAGWPALAAEIPALVLLDRPGGNVDADSIVADDERGGAEATELLVAGGARRIAFVGEQLTLPTIAARHRGYRRALAAKGLAAHPQLTVTGVRTVDEVCRSIVALLTDDPSVDGVFAANNVACLGTVKAFREIGRRRAIVGFDDFDAAAVLDPPVTVVTHDVAEMGRLAAQRLLSRIAGARDPATATVLPTRVIRRGSEYPPISPPPSDIRQKAGPGDPVQAQPPVQPEIGPAARRRGRSRLLR